MAPNRTVTEEIGQSRPFRGPVQAAVVTLLRTADEARRYLARLLEPEGVTVQQFNVLRILRGAGPAGLPTLEIGRRMVERQPGVTRLVDRLLAKGLVDRVRDGQDRRRVVCTIRPRGLELLERVDGHLERMEAEVGPGLEGDGGARLMAGLDRLRARLHEVCPGGE
ncbi:MAG: MarR family transcriptional regulator [Longimicrobiales bacterium]|nr:MarR family transcriptional regulator [Longimicrobiales bacterium]